MISSDGPVPFYGRAKIVLFLLVLRQQSVFPDKNEPIMFQRMFGKPRQEANPLATLDKLNEV